MESSNPTRFTLVKEIFGEALELPPDQRDRLVDERADGDVALAAEVRRLLRSHDAAGRFMDQPAAVPDEATESTDDTTVRLPFERLGPYRLLERVGEGGFGSVYLAEQAEPVRRRVAIKILKPGLDSRQILARFDAERQALALMEHAHIARVYDAGTTPDGRPFFVMESVLGRSITAYCDERRLPPRQRLLLFIDVCQAVHHAHQKGVIHRDIKPGNVIVTEIDGAPVVKVIDFGVAKATQHGRLSAGTAITEARQIIGTPEYMSPEQAATAGLDIDTRSDVYSLGVLLYELLSGCTPFDGEELRRLSLAEMQRRICQDEPPRPSTRIDATRTGHATQRSSDPGRLRSILRGELDWIVMKCLEKDRSRRYESAAALAADCRAFLDGRAVQARPATKMYRVAKFVRRNKLPVGAAAAVLVALVGGLIATSAALYQARVERNRAVAARAAEAEARAVTEQHLRFIAEMFSSIDPEHSRGREVTVREVLDAAAARVAGAFKSSPLVEASVRHTFGLAYSGIGRLGPARDQFEQALALLHAAGAGADARWLSLHGDFGKVQSDLNLNAEAEQTLRQALQLAERQGEVDPTAAASAIVIRDSLANLFTRLGRLSEAEALFEQNQKRLGTPTDPFLMRLLLINTADYARLRHTQGRMDDAARLFDEALRQGKALLGPDHPDVMGIELGIATLLRDRGDFAGSLALMQQVLDRARATFGPDHPNTLSTAYQTALMMSANGRSGEAEALLKDTIARCRATLGEDHVTTLYARHDLLQIWMLTRRNAQAEPELRDLIDRMTRVFGEEHRDTLMFRADLARILSSREQWAEAEALYADILPRLRRVLGPKHPYAMSVQMRHAITVMRQGRWSEAETPLAEVYLENKRTGTAARDWSAAAAYGNCLTQLGQYQSAVPVLLEAETAIRAYPRLDRHTLRGVAGALVECYRHLGQADSEARYRRIQDELASTTVPATRPGAPSAH